MRFARAPLALSALVVAALVPSSVPSARADGPLRWTDATPDAMVDAARARAMTRADKGHGEALGVAGLAVLAELAPRAAYGRTQKALEDVAAAGDVASDVRAEAGLLARSVAGARRDDAEIARLRALGVVTELALVGPFRDTGGGLDRKEGPEGPGSGWGDRTTRWSWGTVDVAWRTVPRAFARPEGVPLDVFIHPRKESCSYVATRLKLPAASSAIVRLAATGQARLMVDGVEVARGEDVHAQATFDRLAARVELAAGMHLVAAKVCASAIDDAGRVRLRVTDDRGVSLAGAASAELDGTKTADAKALKIARVATPLERALGAATKDTKDLDALLGAIVTRTLGGADDTRSPRAQGLVDALVRRPDLDADRLAMAGWIAPSGAARSGWLNQARARAESTHDDRARAFVERRLVAEHANARLVDWAMAAYRGAKIDQAKDSEALLLGAMLADRLGPESLRLRAMHDLARAVDAAPTTAPTALVDQLATMSAQLAPARHLATRELLAARGARGSERVEAMGARGRDAVVASARQALDGEVDDADEALAVAGAASRAGAYDVSRELHAKVVAWAPNRAEAWSALAAAMGASASGDAAEAQMIAALARARQLAPGDARIRAELALRRPPPKETGAEAEGDERYLVASKDVLARRKGLPDKGPPDVADRQLYWLRAVLTHPDKRVSQLIHYSREIVIAPRTQDELYEPIPPEGDLTEILRARVHRKDGTVAFPAEEHNEGDRPRIRWPELAPGDVVEVAIRQWTDRPVGGRGDAPFYFIDYAGATSTHPLLYNEVVVETAPGQELWVDVIHGAAPKKIEKDVDGKHVLRLVWDQPVNVPDEPLSPAMSEIVPVIAGSSFRSWTEFRAWYAEAVKGFTEPDEEVRRLGAELTKGKSTREQKVAALFKFVADDIRYVNYVSGEWWLPNRPQQVIARREGDCDDKALLLIALLKTVGLDAQEVLVQTRLTGEPSLLRARGVAIPRFDHGIAFLPGPGGGQYLDATSPQARIGPLSSMDARAVALRMDGPAEVVELPASSPAEHGSDVRWTLTLHPDGSGELGGEETHSGDHAFWARTYLTEEGARRSFVEGYLVGGWFPTVEIDGTIDFKGELPGGKAWVKYHARSEGLARQEESDLVVPLSRTSTLTSELAPLVSRTLPVALPPHMAPSHETRTTRVLAPAGFSWSTLPAGGEEKGGPFGSAKLDIARDPKDAGAVLVKRTLVFDQHRIPVEKYGEWRAWLQRVDGLLNKKLRLVRGGK